MFRESDAQGQLFAGRNTLLKWVGEETFYAFVAAKAPQWFHDGLFREWYSDDNGRPCVLQWRLAAATLLQMHDRCSDEEAIARTKFDDRWKLVLDLEPEERPFAKSTLQEFRARLLLDGNAEKVFLKVSLDAAREFGLLKGESVKVVLDTTPVTGRGAVKDTFNLLGDAIRQLTRVLSHSTDQQLKPLIEQLQLSRYFDETSIKGGAGIDWTSEEERRKFLNDLVADAKRLLGAAKTALESVSGKRKKPLAQSIALLERLIAQDTEPDPKDPSKVQIKDGTAPDRIVSTTDPEARHGRKSSSKRFDGHKLSTVTEPDSGLIAAVKVIAGNAADNTEALGQVKTAETNIGVRADKAICDCAYGDGATRAQFDDDERTLVAKVPAPPANNPFHKSRFQIDVASDCVTCPAGISTSDFNFAKYRVETPPVKKFFFPLQVCRACPHFELCVSKGEVRRGTGRTVTLHPQERLIQEARAYQKTSAFKEDIKDRQRAEHGFARMMLFGMRQARYFGLAKTEVQGIITAALVNLLVLFGVATAPTVAPLPAEPLEQVQAVEDDNGLPDSAPLQNSNQTEGIRSDGVRGAPFRAGDRNTRRSPK